MNPWYSRSKPQDIQPIPWLCQPVIDRMSEIINKDFNVIEHGSGGSTLWFAERAKFVFSVENNGAWYKELLKRKPENCVLIYNNWLEVPDNWMNYEPFDLLLIDGDPVTERIDWINQCAKIVKKGGWVILDNANRPEYKKEREYLHSISVSYETIYCNKSHSYLVTDICKL